MSSAKWRLFCLGLNVLTRLGQDKIVAMLQTTFWNAYSRMGPINN